MQYMDEEEIRLHELQKERNKLLAKTSSEIINDHMAQGVRAQSSSAEVMKRPDSPD